MKRKSFFLFVLIFFSKYLTAQNIETFCGLFYNSQNNITLKLNLKDENIYVPGLNILGPTNGYMNGNIYGTWIVTNHKISKNTATLRFSNDFGSDAQEITLTYLVADTFALEMKSPLVVRKVVKRKLVKIPSRFIFVKKH